MPEDHHLLVQPAHTVIFSSSKESTNNTMALHVSNHDGSENCDPNLISGSLKRKLKSSSSSVITMGSNTQIVSCVHQQQTQQIVSGIAMAPSILTSPPRKTQHLMCRNPSGRDASESEMDTKMTEMDIKITEIRTQITGMDTEYPSICDKENQLQGDLEASEKDQSSISPEKTGNWRLKAVLEEFGPDLTPTRQGRVKTLVRAFEKLMSSKNKEEEEKTENGFKAREFPLQFTYLNPTGETGSYGLNQAVEGVTVNEQHREVSEKSTDRGEEMLSNQSESGWEYSSGTESLKLCKDGPIKSLVPKSKASHLPSKERKPQVDTSRKNLHVSTVSISRPLHRKQPETRIVHIKARVSKPRPFKLATEERGKTKKEEFIAKLKQIVAEEERLRIPMAQGLPLTTDEPEIPPKPMVKESTVPEDIHLNTDLRAMERAEFDHYISEKLLYLENRRLEEERLRLIAEEEEIKRLRQEMVPKAQMMPYFDRPFRPRRSSKRPTVPKEPHFHYKSMTNSSQL